MKFGSFFTNSTRKGVCRKTAEMELCESAALRGRLKLAINAATHEGRRLCESAALRGRLKRLLSAGSSSQCCVRKCGPTGPIETHFIAIEITREGVRKCGPTGPIETVAHSLTLSNNSTCAKVRPYGAD